MRTEEDVTLWTSFRDSPLRTSVLTVLPIVFAAVQLANSLLTDLSVAIGVFVATALVSAAVVFTRHHLARLRLEALEQSIATDRRR